MKKQTIKLKLVVSTLIEFHSNTSIVEMDTVIGAKGGNGGKCFLTLLFRQYNFMLIYLLPYKQSKYVTEVFNNIKSLDFLKLS